MFRSCPVCGCRDGEVLTRVELTPVEAERLPSAFDVCLCTECLFCFDDLNVTQTDFDAYYASSGKYAQSNTGGSGGSANVDLKRWANVLYALGPWISQTSRIVDVGCGKGGLLAALRAQGFHHVAGIEPSDGCREHLATQGFTAYRSVSECLRDEQPFDCVVCSQVLEHVFALDAFLADLGRLLAPDGVLYIEVPDAAGYAGLFHAPFYYFDREHINHFTRISLSNLVASKLAALPVFCEAHSAFAVEGFETPNVFSVFRRGAEHAKVMPDDEGASKIKLYVRKSQNEDRYPQLQPSINASQSHAVPVLLWGYGAHLRRLLQKGVFQGLNVQGVIDRNKGGKGDRVMGVPILSPDAIANPAFQDATVVITTVLYAGQIEHALRSRSFEGRIVRLSD